MATRLTLAAVVCLSSVGAAFAGSFEKALPADCAAFVSVSDVNKLKSSVTETRFAQMLADPAMQPFVDGVTGEVTKLLDMAEQITGISLPQIVSLPTGQVVIAVRMPDGEGTPIVYFLADCKGNEDATKETLDKIFTTAEELGLNKQEEGELTTFSQGDEGPKVSIAFKGTTLVIGNNAEAIGTVVDSLEGGASDSLADSAGFKAFRERVGGEGDAEVYGNLSKVMELGAGAAGPNAEGIIAMLGLNAFQSAGVSVNVGKGDYETSLQLVVSKKGDVPLMQLFNMPAKPIKPEAWVPDNVVSYTSFNWDLELFYTTLTDMVNAAQPGMMDQVNAMLAGPDPDNPLLDIKNDLIGPLGDRMTIISDIADIDGTATNRMLIGCSAPESEDGQGNQGLSLPARRSPGRSDAGR
jgi:hypothetical protein